MVEVPLEFVKLTVSDAMSAPEIVPVELTVNGIANVNWVPNALEAVVWYHGVNAAPSCTVEVLPPRLVPVVGVKVNSALVISRAVEYPVTETTKQVGEAHV